MKRIREFFARIAGAFWEHRRRETELDEEMRYHLELAAEEHRRLGLSEREARDAALRDFGGLTQVKEKYREQRSLPFFETFAQDISYACRMWRKAPGFCIVVVLILAVGIGANIAMFTLVNGMLFRPMSGRAGELVGLYTRDRTKPDSFKSFSYPNYVDIRAGNDIFDSLVAHTFAIVGLPSGDITRRTFIEVVSANYFSTIGVRMAAGRAFTDEEERPGSNIPVVIANYNRWKDAGFKTSFIGSSVRINAQDFTVVGVAPSGFSGTTAVISPEMWLPLGMFDTMVNDVFKNNGSGLASRTNESMNVVGHLKPGITLQTANARLDVLSKQLEEAHPAENRNQQLSASPLSRVSVSTEPSSDAGPMAVSAVMMPLSGAVLLIACLNIANMFLARGAARKKEIAIRIAIGGGRRRIIRQLVTESLLLASAGAVAGLFVGYSVIQVVLASLTRVLPVPLHLDPRPDLNVLLVTIAFVILSTLVFGVAPALRISRADVVTDLKDLGNDVDIATRRSRRGWLVVVQIAVSLMLMVAGGLFGRAAIRASAANPGYRYDNLLLVSVDAGLAGYDEQHGRSVIHDVLERLRSMPGVDAASMNSQIPFGEFHEGAAVIRPDKPTSETQGATFTIASGDYFKTLGMPVIRGREFTTAEELSNSSNAIIDEPLARRLFPNEDPLGQYLRLAPRAELEAPRDGNAPLQIVGIVPGLRDDLTEDSPAPHLYVPSGTNYRANMQIYVRARDRAMSAPDMLNMLRREVRAVDARLPIIDLTTMQNFHDSGVMLWVLRAAGRTLSAFGAVALLLAAVGVYGVKSYLVSRRTREIGIRVALGASRREILWMVLAEGARMTAIGLLLGFPLAIGVAAILRNAIVGVSIFDPVVMLLAPIILMIAAALATYIPARRATRVSPLEALRSE